MLERLLSSRGSAVIATVMAAVIATVTALSPLAAVITAALIALLGLIAFNAGALLLVLVAAFPWDDALAVPSETVSLIKILGALLIVGYLFRALARDETIRLPPTLSAVMAFMILVLLSLLVSEDPAEGVSQALRYLLFGAFFFVLVQLVRTRSEAHMLLRVLAVSATAAAVVGLAGFVSGAVDRVSGPIGEANDFAYVLACVLPLVVHLAVHDRRLRLAWCLCAGILVVAVFGTLSRGALVGLAALAVWAIVTRRARLGGVLAAAGVAATSLLIMFAFWQPLIDEQLARKDQVAAANVASRQAYWSAALRMAADHPVLGVGPGRYGPEAAGYVLDDPIGIEEPVAHNSYLEVLAEGGLPTLAVFLVFIAGSWRLVSAARRRAILADDREGVRLASAIQASLVVAVVSANFLSVQIMVPLWLLGGLAAAVGPLPGTAAVARRAVAEPLSTRP
jgi:putative inorganic carbon (HCO3(-)) transporter